MTTGKPSCSAASTASGTAAACWPAGTGSPRFFEVQREIQRGSYELYAEVLRRAAIRVAADLGWELENVRSNFLPNSVPSWQPFRETNAQLERFAKKYEIGILANIDDKLLG